MAKNRRFRWIARVGYGARGTVYLVVGALAVMSAFGSGGKATGTRGALAALLQAPFGKFLLVLIAVGLVFYALWRATQAVFDVDNHGTKAKGVFIRLGLGISAVTHFALAAYALSIAFGWTVGGSSGSGGRSGAEGWSAWLLSKPAGQWLLGIAGVWIVAAGVAQLWRGWTEQYHDHLDMDFEKLKWADPFCKIGLIARGTVFVMMGGFVCMAAWRMDPDSAKGLGETLKTLRQQSYGTILLLVAGSGMVAFAFFSYVEAFYRRISVPEEP